MPLPATIASSTNTFLPLFFDHIFTTYISHTFIIIMMMPSSLYTSDAVGLGLYINFPLVLNHVHGNKAVVPVQLQQ